MMEVTAPTEDGRSFLFPFSVVDKGFLGKPEQASATAERWLIVSIARRRLPAWALNESNLIRVLFEYGRRDVEKQLKAGQFQETYTFTVSTFSHPTSSCPFEPSLIQEPDGCEMEVEVERRIGYR